jgi:hypothetical protein
MPLRVPQFIDREMKVFGPLTMRQTVFIGFAVAGAGVLYVFLAKSSMSLFLLFAFFIIIAGVALAFVQVEGKNLPTTIINFFSYTFSSRNYLWKKKIMPLRIVKTFSQPASAKSIDKKAVLKISGKSRIEGLSKKLETGIGIR